MTELNLSVTIMPSKHVIVVTVCMKDTIADMKRKLSAVMQFPAESIKIVNGGRPCDDSSIIEEIGLNYCSKVICAARGFVPKEEKEQTVSERCDSKLLIKLDGTKSIDVPYNKNSTWRQLKINLQKLAHIDPIDYVILLNDNVVNDNDAVANARVNYMSVIHAVRRNFHSLLEQPLQRSLIYIPCTICKTENPTFVVRPLCADCRNGCVVFDFPFNINETITQTLFSLTGKCHNRECRYYQLQTTICLSFICKSCPVNSTKDRIFLLLLRPTTNEAIMKQQLNSLFGY